ncbi:MAG: DUF373 family protein [Candidatus Bilamarchaeaceae archaeon]
MERPTLILCIDRDNDLYEKAKISGPVIGRDRNLLAVTKLGLADPEDSDVNAILAAIRIYDKMKSEGKTVEIATLTGDKRLGYEADKRISMQLEKIITERNPESAVLVTDGASDEEVFPIIKSRIKIDSTKIVIVKQSKELEKTYFILLEKLKDPYYAKILIGIPALLILLFSAADYLGVGWQPVGIVIGAYLIARMMGIDEVIGSAIRDFRFSIEKTSWLGYLAGFTLFLIALIVGYQNFEGGLEARLSSEKLVAYVLQGVLWPLLASFVFIIVGKSMDAMAEKKVYKLTKYSMYLIGAILTTMLLKIGTSWVLNIREPYVSFGDFLLAIVVAIFLGYISTLVISWIKFDVIKRMKIDGKEVVTSDGSLVGKIVGIDVKNEKLVVQGVLEKKYGYPFSSILAVDEKVVIKLEG